MKKIVLTFALLLTALAGFAQSASDIATEMKSEKGVQMQVIPRMMLQMGMAQMPDGAAKEAMKKVNEMTVMQFTAASEETKAAIVAKVEALAENGYTLFQTVEEDGAKVKVYTKTEEEAITELVNLVEAGGENVFIVIKGKFAESDLSNLMNM